MPKSQMCKKGFSLVHFTQGGKLRLKTDTKFVVMTIKQKKVKVKLTTGRNKIFEEIEALRRTRLFVEQVRPEITKADLEKTFLEYGKIEQIYVINKSRKHAKPKRSCVVVFEDPASIQKLPVEGVECCGVMLDWNSYYINSNVDRVIYRRGVDAEYKVEVLEVTDKGIIEVKEADIERPGDKYIMKGKRPNHQNEMVMGQPTIQITRQTAPGGVLRSPAPPPGLNLLGRLGIEQGAREVVGFEKRGSMMSHAKTAGSGGSRRGSQMKGVNWLQAKQLEAAYKRNHHGEAAGVEKRNVLKEKKKLSGKSKTFSPSEMGQKKLKKLPPTAPPKAGSRGSVVLPTGFALSSQATRRFSQTQGAGGQGDTRNETASQFEVIDEDPGLIDQEEPKDNQISIKNSADDQQRVHFSLSKAFNSVSAFNQSSGLLPSATLRNFLNTSPVEEETSEQHNHAQFIRLGQQNTLLGQENRNPNQQPETRNVQDLVKFIHLDAPVTSTELHSKRPTQQGYDYGVLELRHKSEVGNLRMGFSFHNKFLDLEIPENDEVGSTTNQQSPVEMEDQAETQKISQEF